MSQKDSTQRHSSRSSVLASLHAGDLLSVMCRRIPSIVIVTSILFCMVLGVLVAMPNAYRSEGLFYVRLGRGAVSVDPTSQASDSISIQDSRTSEVISISEMLSSREIADRVVEQVGADRINQPRTWIARLGKKLEGLKGSPSADDESLADGKSRAELIALEEAAVKVQKSVGFSIAKNAYTVAVSATTTDPFLARDIVQSYLDQYGSFHLEAHQISGSYDFFDQLAEQNRAAAAAAKQRLQQRRSELGWMSPERAEEALQSRIIELDIALDKANSDLADSNDLVAALEKQLSLIKPWVPIQTSRVANLAADEMKRALYESRIAESETLSKFKPSHPRYKRLTEKYAAGENAILDESDTEEETTEAVNPVHQQLVAELELTRAKAKGLAARRDSLIDSLQQAETKLARLNHDSIELADLAMAAEIAERNYIEQSESLEQARVHQELDRQKLSDISVIQDASLNLKKAGPKRAILAVVGLMASLCMGLAQALVRPLPPAVAERVENRITNARSLADRAATESRLTEHHGHDHGRLHDHGHLHGRDGSLSHRGDARQHHVNDHANHDEHQSHPEHKGHSINGAEREDSILAAAGKTSETTTHPSDNPRRSPR